MKEIRIMKADQIGGKEVKPVTLVIDDTLPDFSAKDSEPIEEAYNYDAELLAGALFQSLPQGTMERLIIKLLKLKVSVYRGITKW